MDLLLKCLMSFSLLVFLGSLLALVAVLLPGLLEYVEPAPPGAGLGLGPPAQPPALAAAPAGSTAPAEPPPLRPAPAGEDPGLAAAVGLALALFLAEGTEAAAPSVPPRGSPWVLAGRWQAMQQRREFRKR